MTTRTKQDRLLNALQNGNEISVSQAIRRFGFESTESVTSAVSKLRRRGFAVYANANKSGVARYRLGTPTRAIVAAGYSVIGA